LRAAASYLQGHNAALILGDNIFGAGLSRTIETSMAENPGATIFGYEVADPSSFGMVSIDAQGRASTIEEKPADPKSRITVTRLYLYAADVFDMTSRVLPSARNELEISDLNRLYLEQGRLRVCNLGRGVAWLDGGTPELQDRTGLRIACPEEIAYRRGFIDRQAFSHLGAETAVASTYRIYCSTIH
jgi:glucose-1-phosphate thymidylyltransferase